MTKPVKKPEFLLPFPRLFARAEGDAYDAMAFRASDSFGDESAPALAAPLAWGTESVAMMAEAACPAIPAETRAVEENTVPSWLWHRRAQGSRRAAEGDLRDIFDRAAGSAAAAGWKLGLFTGEKNARAFYDETRCALMQRIVALTPDIIANWGLNWAYGIKEEPAARKRTSEKSAILTNAAMEASGDAAALWKKLFTTRGDQPTKIVLRLSDTTQDWHAAPNPARAAIDVLALRHNDGSVNIDALRHAARLLTVLLDLHNRHDVTINLVNLAPLLMALGLAYDSDAARALAASLVALVTAECAAASAEMAALRGASDAFTAQRDDIMRGLRNHRRAVYGDGNDYEKLSVLPTALALKNCPDLALAAEAQRRWDEALAGARAFGLRATQFTDMTPSPVLAVLMGSMSQGLEPMHSLTVVQGDDDGHFHTAPHAAVGEALTRLGYARTIIAAALRHIAGAASLRAAPAINHVTLRARGLDDTALEKIESYLPGVDNIRLAITPWIIGMEFCRERLKISAKHLQSPRFDLLKHLGFTDADCAAANAHCYGSGNLRHAKIIALRQRPIFACAADISPEARLRMAAAAQSLISADTGVSVTLPAAYSTARAADLTRAAWQRGLKSLMIILDPALAPPPDRAPATTRRLTAAPQAHAKAFKPTPRLSRGKRVGVVTTGKTVGTRRGL